MRLGESRAHAPSCSSTFALQAEKAPFILQFVLMMCSKQPEEHQQILCDEFGLHVSMQP